MAKKDTLIVSFLITIVHPLSSVNFQESHHYSSVTDPFGGYTEVNG